MLSRMNQMSQMNLENPFMKGIKEIKGAQSNAQSIRFGQAQAATPAFSSIKNNGLDSVHFGGAEKTMNAAQIKNTLAMMNQHKLNLLA